MNITIYNGDQVKNQLYSGNIDFDADTFKAMLVRDGFNFNSSSHKYKKNLHATTGAINYTVTATSKTFTRATGSFVTDGFVVGNVITTDGTNVGPYQVAAVTALTMRVTLVDEATIVDETATTKTITADDEVKNINLTVTFSATASSSKFTRASGTFYGTDGLRVGQVITTTSATNPGPFQIVSFSGADMVLTPVGAGTAVADEVSTSYDIDNTYTQSGKTVTFTVSGNTLTLDSFDISDFNPARFGSPGAVIYDDSNSLDAVICYIKFSPWTLSF